MPGNGRKRAFYLLFRVVNVRKFSIFRLFVNFSVLSSPRRRSAHGMNKSPSKRDDEARMKDDDNRLSEVSLANDKVPVEGKLS